MAVFPPTCTDSPITLLLLADPILPPNVYECVLEKMFLEIEDLSSSPTSGSSIDSGRLVRLDQEAGIHFLESLLAWGPTKTLKEYIKLHKRSRERRKGDGDGSKSIVDGFLKTVEVALQRRYLQTAAGYLNFPIPLEEQSRTLEVGAPRYEAHKDDSQDALYRIDRILKWVAPRAPLVALPEEILETEETNAYALPPYALPPNNQTCLESMARLRMMQNRYDLALQCFLAIGACHSPRSLDELEKAAVDVVNGVADPNTLSKPILVGSSSYEYVLGIIEFHHLHQLLLDKDFIQSTADSEKKSFIPLLALLRLVGLQSMGEFLMEHCVSAEFSSFERPAKHDESEDAVRRETLPIDRVAEQLEFSPALLHWYLHLVFSNKPELYVKFPNNSIPPKTVTELHRKHFKLYVDFAGDAKDSAKSLSGTEKYKIEAKTTPLLSFLKVGFSLVNVACPVSLYSLRSLWFDRLLYHSAEFFQSTPDVFWKSSVFRDSTIPMTNQTTKQKKRLPWKRLIAFRWSWHISLSTAVNRLRPRLWESCICI
jgi:hypothetical protein